ncbi:mitochondrion protein [Pisolithus orientalis]|uniref:mitochondrion protein n=1 Tax=Pisolithus orientalis TaxID=936130 RepID=UPI002224520E|nr:mitochondrion protein [Pisolithus orientalis]KAI6034935.1 mitochondrion protein [Pisolithus orientalis]
MMEMRRFDNALDAEGAAIRGAVEGTVMGAAVTLPSFYILNRQWPYFRSLPLQLKTLAAIIIILPTTAIRAEHRMIDYERSHWDSKDKYAVERRAHEERLRWDSLSVKDKFADWTARHQLSYVVGSWALAMAVSGAIIMRDPHLPVRHKVVQARVWAQGLTLGVIIATGALTHSQHAKAAQMRKRGDHSWEDVLDDQQRKVRAVI